MRLWHVPIEPLPMRYSEQWSRWFRARWPRDEWIDVEPVPREIRTGDFLDVHWTQVWKARQVERIARLLTEECIGEGDTLLFHDFWFPLEQVYYMLDAVDLDVRVVVIAHAGSYSRNDLLARTAIARWAPDVESAWLRRADRVVVFSPFHRSELVRWRGVDPSRIGVVPFPYDLRDLGECQGKKDVDVVFPARRGADKGWDALGEFADRTGVRPTTTADCRTRAEYHDVLRRARYVLSWPPSETFGIAVLEATALGAIPLVPRRAAYADWYGEVAFRSLAEAADAYLDGWAPRPTDGWPSRRAESGFDLLRGEALRG